MKLIANILLPDWYAPSSESEKEIHQVHGLISTAQFGGLVNGYLEAAGLALAIETYPGPAYICGKGYFGHTNNHPLVNVT
ncbi:hypothetical protein MGLY_26150 [Neomoorella glycerini]|uniref:Uncharacterized protein n=1 Tax=Neomoorella glycerini TaxID=55779 RepID=A0A6I5ZU54_9FIRM|nr:hypothetical protein MGLY_26150 [Moorella glycerini]